MLASQPEKSNMGPVQADFHDFVIFEKVIMDLWPGICCVFGLVPSQDRFSRLWAGTKKMRDEKLCRFVVVSAREVPSLSFSCRFKIRIFRLFLKAPLIYLSRFRECSVH